MRIVPPYTPDIQAWAENIRRFLGKALNQLDAKDQYSSAAEDGVILYDRVNKYVVVSSTNAFKQVATQQSAPASSVGSVGDVANMIAWDTNYIYICTASYDGSTAIWKRVALSTW
tara:strand:+ start:1670 stop:2014 length:345 start_codon:yes stop_codon:yes gene_type:complete